jgi:murein DD-endopeptidase MepM/ murein hydrolase activator NlpD
MNSRKLRKRKKGTVFLVIIGTVLAAGIAGAVVLSNRSGSLNANEPNEALASKTETKPAAPKRREMVDFHMVDLERGWIRYADGVTVTSDGGQSWQEAAAPLLLEAESAAGADMNDWYGLVREAKSPATASFNGKEYPVRQSQFVTDRFGWAMVIDGGELAKPHLVTADGGETWQADVNPAVKEAALQERELQRKLAAESAFYSSPEVSSQSLSSTWTLFPDTVSPGDVLLVRHDQPGSVDWQGKTFELKPFGAGYFTYIPIGLGVKAGEYPIGDKTLKIAAKKFQTQYLQVTQQMESMKQDTGRISADQKKIDAARSQSAPEFLFTEDFVKPIEGILTTPYGYTRYVNGKYDSSHQALDLAAKEGTPIKATNDGIVALADSLYLTGNSIYLDHGMGLFSQYAHMSKLNVKTGDRVKKGDIIGLVGTTGFSTGPHLHFTYWAHNTPVNPDLFFNTTPFHWLKLGQ